MEKKLKPIGHFIPYLAKKGNLEFIW